MKNPANRVAMLLLVACAILGCGRGDVLSEFKERNKVSTCLSAKGQKTAKNRLGS